MTGVIYFLIIFFLLLILSQIFLAYVEKVTEGMETASTSTSSTPVTTGTTKSATTTSGTTKSGTTTSGTTTSSPPTINAASINSTNPSYMPYTSNSENILTFIEQNANNISFLKNQYDNLYQQVLDISGNMTNIDNKATLSSKQATQVNSIVSQAQAAMPTSPPKVTGTSQSPQTTAQVTSYASGGN